MDRDPGFRLVQHSAVGERFQIVGSLGECDLELDDGKRVRMKPGDICVQRGTMHAWAPVGPEPAVFAFVLIDADPVAMGGKKLTTDYPTR